MDEKKRGYERPQVVHLKASTNASGDCVMWGSHDVVECADGNVATTCAFHGMSPSVACDPSGSGP